MVEIKDRVKSNEVMNQRVDHMKTLVPRWFEVKENCLGSIVKRCLNSRMHCEMQLDPSNIMRTRGALDRVGEPNRDPKTDAITRSNVLASPSHTIEDMCLEESPSRLRSLM